MSAEVDRVEEIIRWACDISQRMIPHHDWPGPRPTATQRSAGVLRDGLELRFAAECLVRALRDGATHGDLEAWVRATQAPPPVVAPPTPKRIPVGSWRRPRGAYLYGPAGSWLFTSRAMRLTDDQVDAYLASEEQRDATHVVVTLSHGTRPALGEQPFDALASAESRAHVRRRLQYLIDRDRLPWVYLCSQEYSDQRLGRDHGRLVRYCEEAAETFGDLASVVVVHREIGDVYQRDRLAARRELHGAIRAMTDARRTAIGVHERAGEGIPIADVDGLPGAAISMLQAPFHWKLRGGTGPDYVVGGHRYDGVFDLCRHHADRMAAYQDAGRVEEASVGIFECSIPPNHGFTKHPRTFAHARAFGDALIREGVAWELSGGAAPREDRATP